VVDALFNIRDGPDSLIVGQVLYPSVIFLNLPSIFKADSSACGEVYITMIAWHKLKVRLSGL
jgi:hypothetical protein